MDRESSPLSNTILLQPSRGPDEAENRRGVGIHYTILGGTGGRGGDGPPGTRNWRAGGLGQEPTVWTSNIHYYIGDSQTEFGRGGRGGDLQISPEIRDGKGAPGGAGEETERNGEDGSDWQEGEGASDEEGGSDQEGKRANDGEGRNSPVRPEIAGRSGGRGDNSSLEEILDDIRHRQLSQREISGFRSGSLPRADTDILQPTLDSPAASAQYPPGPLTPPSPPAEPIPDLLSLYTSRPPLVDALSRVEAETGGTGDVSDFDSWAKITDSLIKQWGSLGTISIPVLGLTAMQMRSTNGPGLQIFLLFCVFCLSSILSDAMVLSFFCYGSTKSIAERWVQDIRTVDPISYWNIWVLFSLPVVWACWWLLFLFISLFLLAWEGGRPGFTTGSAQYLEGKILAVILLPIWLGRFGWRILTGRPGGGSPDSGEVTQSRREKTNFRGSGHTESDLSSRDRTAESATNREIEEKTDRWINMKAEGRKYVPMNTAAIAEPTARHAKGSVSIGVWFTASTPALSTLAVVVSALGARRDVINAILSAITVEVERSARSTLDGVARTIGPRKKSCTARLPCAGGGGFLVFNDAECGVRPGSRSIGDTGKGGLASPVYVCREQMSSRLCDGRRTFYVQKRSIDPRAQGDI
ncbi:hypothetical protein B0H14DRAFT_3162685 [Mycena olivaceomarginata]|nr:hypothetical protein B0H14DRAFT_3162685 [Mycena olivaceomarginata]